MKDTEEHKRWKNQAVSPPSKKMDRLAVFEMEDKRIVGDKINEIIEKMNL